MIGDFDDNANALWSLHLEEAKSHDDARIHSLKDDMDGVLIFVRVYIPIVISTPSSCIVIQAGLFSAALTSFLVDKIHDLQPDPAQQMVFYQQQNVVLLAQISEQISSFAPQISIPSAPLPSYDFNLNPSDVRVNAFWFMSLVFSLLAALLATLVQQWIRNYMHVFTRYSNPLKSARLRQYLYEGVEGWYMPMVAESVPGLVHVSLFLFFVGLGDFLFTTNTTVGVTTVVPIAICGLLYVFGMFAPLIQPQSPFRNTFSGLVWYLKQKVHPRRYWDRVSGGYLRASSNLSEGQMQLAMEENDRRMDRDVRAMRWLIHNRTEDDEMESFVMAIPGSFTSKWGVDVWRKVSEVKQHEDAKLKLNSTVRSQSNADTPIPGLLHHRSPLFQRIWYRLHSLGRIIRIRTANDSHDVMLTRSMPHLPSDSQALDDPRAHGDLAIYDLCNRVRHLVGTCDNHSVFINKELWLKRARGCVETAASLVVCADINPELFGDLGKLLHRVYQFPDIYQSTVHDATELGSDGLFVARWTCLSFVIINQGMADHGLIKLNARVAINGLSHFRMEDEGEQSNDGDDDDENALWNAQMIDNYFETAREFCMYGLRAAFEPSGVRTTEEQVREVLARDHEADISMLEDIALAAHHVANIDTAIDRINDSIYDFSDGLLRHVRGALFDVLEQTEVVHPIQFFSPDPIDKIPAFLTQFIFLHQRLRLLCSYSSKLRDIIDGKDNGAYQDILTSLETLWDESDNRKWTAVRWRHLMERQLWRLQDFRDAGGFGFWVELLVLVTYQLSTIPLSPDTHSALMVGTFRAVASNWRQHKHSIGTQRVILNLICDIAIFDRGLMSDVAVPAYIADELLVLLRNMVEGQSGSHIDDAMKELEDAIEEQQDVAPEWVREVCLFREKVVAIISRLRAPIHSS